MAKDQVKDVLTPEIKKIILINNKNKKFDIRKEVMTLDYYEDIFSPYVTATITLLDAEFSKTVELAGGEVVIIEFRNALSEKWIKNAFVVDKIDKVSNTDTSTLNFISLNLVTIDYKVNYYAKLTNTYEGKFSEIVEKILEELNEKVRKNSGAKDKQALKELNLNKEKNIQETDKKLKINVNYKSPYTIIYKYLNRATYKSGDDERYGFFFYENRDGYNLKAIDELAKKEPKFYFTKSAVNFENVPLQEKRLAIEAYNIKSVNNMELNSVYGVYSSRSISVNPFEGFYEESLYNCSELLTTDLGSKLPDFIEEYKNDGNPTRTFVYVDNPEIFTNDDSKNQYEVERVSGYVVKSTMRYNLFLLNRLVIYIPGNTDVTVGDVVNVAFPEKKMKSSSEDEIISGRYLVSKATQSVRGEFHKTVLTLFRDTIGNTRK